MLTCKDASRLISERHERPLSFRERWGLRLHLMMCLYCRRFERQVALISRALRRLGRQTEGVMEGSEFTPEARERIRKAVANHYDH